MTFCPRGVFSRDILWKVFWPGQFASAAFCPMTVCLLDVFSCNTVFVWRFVMWRAICDILFSELLSCDVLFTPGNFDLKSKT